MRRIRAHSPRLPRGGRSALQSFAGLSALLLVCSCRGSEPKTALSTSIAGSGARSTAATQGGPSILSRPNVAFADTEGLVLSPAEVASWQRQQEQAATFARSFVFSEFPATEAAPTQPGAYGSIDGQLFAIEHIELWPRGRDFVLRAASGGPCRCLGVEWIISGQLEERRYTLHDNNARGFARVPRPGSASLAVANTQTNIVQAPANGMLEIASIRRDEHGTMTGANGRFVYTQYETSSEPRVWVAANFDLSAAAAASAAAAPSAAVDAPPPPAGALVRAFEP